MTELKYQPDIDGLRGIAVLAVLLFHLDVPGFAGGYVGVDVFFVISGFLITKLIVSQISDGNFSFKSFYVRRARRLFPSLFFTIVVTFVLGIVLFSPEHLQRLGGSSLATVFSVSNFFFWQESGYFDTSADFKPLLHTWSLSIEEQFYLVWPGLLVILFSRLSKTVTPVFITVVAFISLYFAERHVHVNSTSVFFLAPYRAYEFCIGAILVFATHQILKHRHLGNLCVAIGVLLIGYAIFSFNQSTPFPGLGALIPCVGAALCICGSGSKISKALLTNRLLVGTGLVSYSLYLIHWPVYVFYKYYVYRELTGFEKLNLAIAAVLISVLMFKFIESPFRYRKNSNVLLQDRTFVLSSMALAVIFLLPVAHAWANNGWKSRTQESNELVELAKREYSKDNKCSDYRVERIAGANIRKNCFTNSKNRYILIGDSHAIALSKGIALARVNGQDTGYTVVANAGTLPFIGVRSFSALYEYSRDFDDALPSAYKLGVKENIPVLLHSRWAMHWENTRFEHEKANEKWVRLPGESAIPTSDQSKENFVYGLQKTLELANELGVNLTVVGALPNLGNYISNCVNRPTYILPLSSPYGCYGLTYQQQIERISDVNDVLEEAVSGFEGMIFVDPEKIFCNSKNYLCESVQQGRLLYKDDQHLSADGALFLLKKSGLL